MRSMILSIPLSMLVLTACGTGGGGSAMDDEPGVDAGVCSLPDAGVGTVCATDGDCTCGTMCSGLRCVAPAACDEALLSWDGPVSNTDQTCLTDIGGYRLYWGTTQGGPYPHMLDLGMPCNDGPPTPCGTAGAMPPMPKCSYRLADLPNGPVYFVMTTYNASGVESAPTGEVSKVVTCP